MLQTTTRIIHEDMTSPTANEEYGKTEHVNARTVLVGFKSCLARVRCLLDGECSRRCCRQQK